MSEIKNSWTHGSNEAYYQNDVLSTMKNGVDFQTKRTIWKSSKTDEHGSLTKVLSTKIPQIEKKERNRNRNKKETETETEIEI